MTDVKTKPYVEGNTLHYDGWYSNGGGMSYNRDCLGVKDPEQTYNYIKRHGITPEEFGIHSHNYLEIQKLNRAELISLCIEQQENIDGMLKTGMF